MLFVDDPICRHVGGVLIIRKNVLGCGSPAGFSPLSKHFCSFPYLRFLIFPPFALYLEPPLSNLPILWNLFSALIFAAGLIFLKNRKIASWSAVWLFTLIPVLGLIRIETTLDERFLYLPSVSFCILAGAWLKQYLEYRSKKNTVQNKQCSSALFDLCSASIRSRGILKSDILMEFGGRNGSGI